MGLPEGPLSDLGRLGYMSYWQAVLLDIFQSNPDIQITIRELSMLTSIRQEDLITALHSLGFLDYWKNEEMIW